MDDLLIITILVLLFYYTWILDNLIYGDIVCQNAHLCCTLLTMDKYLLFWESFDSMNFFNRNCHKFIIHFVCVKMIVMSPLN